MPFQNPMNTKRAQSIVGTSEGRPVDDFYPTPPEATRALLSVEKFSGSIWEPACGDGAISKVLIAQGYDVVSTDLIDRGYGVGGRNFLTTRQLAADNIVTNPPFKLAEQFVVHAKHLGAHKIAMLLKLNFLEGAARSTMLQTTKLSRVWVFATRLKMGRNAHNYTANGMIAFAWFVWDKDHTGLPTVGWIDTRNLDNSGEQLQLLSVP